jgi:beta-phosphoglucomutase-like phosphatase (HAD superfamily)
MEFMDLVISNEDVKNSKPHPEMYWKAISMMSCLPEETLNCRGFTIWVTCCFSF